MYLDVKEIKDFYYRSTLGRAAKTSINKNLSNIWPETAGLNVMGFGFSLPFLGQYLDRSRRVISLMPAQMGVLAWPNQNANVSVLVDEKRWPIDTGQVDRLIVSHSLEHTRDPSILLAEAYRVLGPGGRALFIVPNRAGLWSRSDRTPFGQGKPFSSGQLETQLRLHGFLPEKQFSALYMLPSRNRSLQRFAPFLEKMGEKLPFFVGGLIILEVSKLPDIVKGSPILDHKKKGMGVLEGFSNGQPKPVLEINN
jgi:Methylase involved in ubiquinone/menaquinone biosynthesis